MSEQESEIKTPQFEPSQKSSDLVAVAAIAAVVIVTLACTFSCTLLGYFFFSNPPW